MKKITFWLIVLTSILSASTFSGCKKVWDYVKQHPDGTASNCSIERVTFSFFPEYSLPSEGDKPLNDTLNITYNTEGNPVSMKYTSSRYPEIDPVDVFSSDHLLRYDSKNRLVVFLQNVSDNVRSDWAVCILWHKYTYVNNNLITDSIFPYGSGNYLVSDRPEGGVAPYTIVEITLDNYGRIIKTSTWNTKDPARVEKAYTYDASGNLVKPGVTYSNKTNIKQTNKVWMFLAGDYSVNAPAGEALAYNSNNLPVLYRKRVPFFAEPYLTPDDSQAKIYYNCK
ncbi:MAG: hypothetical protein QM768_05195 [Agriterribacter sp.]